jgi:dipeptidyl aminopeptidase/acylaminoacyl peptidase
MSSARFRTALVLFVGLGPLASGAGEKFALTIDNIMRGPNLVGTEPSQVHWSPDGSKVYFHWKQAADPIADPLQTWEANRDGTGLRKLTDDEARLEPSGGDLNEDRSKAVYSLDGDLVLVDAARGTRRQITKTSEVEGNPRFWFGGRHITFTRGSNLYLLSLENGDLEQLTDIRSGPETPAGEGKGTEAQELLRKEQREMFDVVRERLRVKEEGEARQKARAARKPHNLQARQNLSQLQLSPDGKYVTALLSESPKGSKNSPVPAWITDSSYPETLLGRPRVGDAGAERKLIILDVATGEARNVEHAGIEAGAGSIADGSTCAEPSTGAASQPVYWSPDGSKAVFGARSADNKNCWLMALDVAGAKARVLFHEHNDAWIGGPDGGNGWLGDSKTFYFTSEKDGFNHLYTVPFEGGEVRQLTAGKWEIDKVSLSRDRQSFYMVSSEGSPYERHLFRMPVEGGARTRLTTTAGMHAPVLSPDETAFADVYSYSNKPPELYVQPKVAAARPVKITSSPAPDFASYGWLDTPIVEIPARDGVLVPARLYKPAVARAGAPAVIFVHGAGYLQNVHKGWTSSYYREYMFHHLLVQRGFVVLDIDYRGSKGYGRDWRTAIYRHMGSKDLDDQVDAAKWLAVHQGVDPKKIGIYGGSYGGFITLMAMFTQPDVFAAGAALRPVTDWAYYNHRYSGNILNLPQKDSEAYHQSSPIYFAGGLKGKLLIAHGMVDTNVQFVDTVRLVQKLIELKKENWELAVYPVEDHAFVQPASWADEYKRILKLFESTLTP